MRAWSCRNCLRFCAGHEKAETGGSSGEFEHLLIIIIFESCDDDDDACARARAS